MKILKKETLCLVQGSKKSHFSSFALNPCLSNFENQYNEYLKENWGIDRNKCKKTGSYKDFLVAEIFGLPFMALKSFLKETEKSKTSQIVEG